MIQELSREGIFPFSSFFASNKPFNAPLAGLSFQYGLSCIFLFSVPPGDAYLFLVNCKLELFLILLTFTSTRSILILYNGRQHFCLPRPDSPAHPVVQIFGMEFTLPGAKDPHSSLFCLQRLFALHSFLSTCRGRHNVPAVSLLGTLPLHSVKYFQLTFFYGRATLLAAFSFRLSG